MEEIGGGGGGGVVEEIVHQQEEMKIDMEETVVVAGPEEEGVEDDKLDSTTVISSGTATSLEERDMEEGGINVVVQLEPQEEGKIVLDQTNKGDTGDKGIENDVRDGEMVIQEAKEMLDSANSDSSINVDVDVKLPTTPLEEMSKVEVQPQSDIKSLTTTTDKSVVVPLSSPKIPSLGQVMAESNRILRVTNKDMLPTVPPPAPLEATNNKDQVNGNSLSKLLTSTKSLSFALSKPCTSVEGILEEKSSRETKRKLHGGCSNVKCTTNSDNLVIARKPAMLFFRFNTSYKKVHKICTACNQEAENFMKNTMNALKTEQNVFAFKPKPQGVEGEVIEVNDDEEEDDPQDVRRLEAEDREIVGFTENLDDVINGILSKLDLKSQLQRCEQTAAFDSANLEREFLNLEKQISFVERQVGETKKIYDKVTGYYQAVPVITEEIDISANGIIVKSRAENEHLQKIPNLPTLPPGIYRPKSESHDGDSYPNRPRKAKENRPHYADDGDIVELESVATPLHKIPCPLAGPPKEIPRVVPATGSIVYAQNRTLLHFWMKAEIEEIVDVGAGKSPEFIVRFEKRQGLPGGGTARHSKRVTAKQIAYNIPCPFILIVGTRIIAKFRDELKTEPIGDGQYYAGLVAEPPHGPNGFRYLIFFDDGYAQYVDYKDVLLVYEYSKDVWSDVHPDSSEFIKSYINKYPERPMVRMSLGQVVTTEWNGKWWVARVVELDCSLVKMKFENDGRCEWIYRGSTRLSPLYEKQTRHRTRKTARRTTSAPIYQKNQPRIEYNYGDDELVPVQDKNKPLKPTARKSTGAHQALEKEYGDIRRLARLDYGEFEGSIIKRPVPADAPERKVYVPHLCDVSCVHYYDDTNKEYKKMSPLAIPLHLGFAREIAKTPRRSVYYRGPCGIRIRDLEELYDYLTQTMCEIPIDHFCFDLAMDCLNEFRHSRQHSFLPDLTYGKENVPVQVVNAFDYEYPPYVEYASQRIAGAGVHLNTDDEFLVGCECEDDCRDKSKCRCWQMTFSGISFTKLNNPDYPVRGYEYRRLKDHIVSGIYECNPKCKCAKTCCNRVAQNGLKVPLQVFKTAAKGWGIRPLFDIPEGAFICIYAGQVLTDAGANEDGKQFGDEYLAELDFIESIESVKADYESDVTDIETEEPGECSRKRNARKEKGRGEDFDMEVDNHAGDSSYRGPKPSAERTVSTRGKKNGSASSKNSDSDDEEGDGGARPRSHFNADVVACKTKVTDRLPLREYFGEDEECYIMDAKTTGNIGRYLNHSCQPNVFVQNVFVDTHDLRFPWVAFFASKHIRAGSELTWDYNYEIGSVPNKVLFCYCGSPDCRGRLL